MCRFLAPKMYKILGVRRNNMYFFVALTYVKLMQHFLQELLVIFSHPLSVSVTRIQRCDRLYLFWRSICQNNLLSE